MNKARAFTAKDAKAAKEFKSDLWFSFALFASFAVD